MIEVTESAEPYEFTPDPDRFVSEILCDRCKYKYSCYIEEDNSYPCKAYRVLECLVSNTKGASHA